MHDTKSRAIVLAGNQNFIAQLSTTIKSIFYHNKNVKIYVLNRDILPDWFRKPRKMAQLLGGDLIDVKLNPDDVKDTWWTQEHISLDAYSRYFIPKYISEEKVLYLDADLLVLKNLEDIFEIDMKGHPIAAVMDTDNQSFNSGVLLIDNGLWKRENMTEQLVNETNGSLQQALEGNIPKFNGDQTIFNKVFRDRWLALDKRMNLQVGHDVTAFMSHWPNHFKDSEDPYVVHFVSHRKPWATLSANRFRQLWWAFHDMDYSQVLSHHMGDFQIEMDPDYELHLFNLTNSQSFKNLEELIQGHPKALFHIAAYTEMGEELMRLAKYENVRLYPEVVPPVLEELINRSAAYLDINYGTADQATLAAYAKTGKPILSFPETRHSEQAQLEVNTIEQMHSLIKERIKTGEWGEVHELPRLHSLTMTQTQDLESIEELVCALPFVQFHIGAWTAMGPKLVELKQHPNVSLYPAINQEQLSQLIHSADIYLDINHGDEAGDILSQVELAGIPSFGFYKTQHGNHGQFLFSSERPQELITAIEQLDGEGSLPKILPLPTVKSIDESLDFIRENHSSVIRFGDGEINLIAGHSIAYQDYHPELARTLRELVGMNSSEKLLVCLPDAFEDRFKFTWWAEDFWKKHLDHYDDFYSQIAPAPWYGSTFISRPYIDFLDKTNAESQFEKLKRLWENKNLLIVEGATSRSGVGNDLFDQALSIKRIVCSSHCAYKDVDAIESTIRKYADNHLILIMLGPTAKVLVANLAKDGYQALDIGHIDSEYEWLKMGATTKVKLKHKHTAEYNFDQDIEFIEDETYTKQIVADLSRLPVE